MKYILASLVAILAFGVPWAVLNYPNETGSVVTAFEQVIQNASDELAAVILAHNPKTLAQIQSKYNSSTTLFVPQSKVRILLVPGHEPGYGGADYRDIHERNMTVELAQDLSQFLAGNDRYQVFVTRDATSWSPTFADYFKNGWDDIIAWQKAHKDEVANMTRLGEFHDVAPEVIHNSAPTDVALRLYGIDKWVDENDIDIVIHIHFNDYPGHPYNQPGDYSGFAIYVPEGQFYNSSTTQVLANSVFDRLKKYTAVSNLPGEKSGIVEDQDLIAIGAYNSVDAPSMLIEYGYIYQPEFVNPTLRPLAIRDLALQTFLGLQDFFDPHTVVASGSSPDTLLVPHTWNTPMSDKSAYAPDVFALQTVLAMDGDYPPSDKSKNDCPRSGSFGPCTKAALDAFQKKHNISGEKGMVGSKTLEVLNGLYAVKAL